MTPPAPRRVVIDVETKNTFDDVGGRSLLHRLEPSVIGTYDYAADAYRAYRDTELDELASLLRATGLVIGFNHRHFDLPILAERLGAWVMDLPALDLMQEAKAGPRVRLSLSALAQGTLGAAKSGDGLEAVRLYREGDWARLERYCLDDVRITRLLYEFGLERGYLYYSRTAVRPPWWKGDARDPDDKGVAAVSYGRADRRELLERSAADGSSVRITYRGRPRILKVTSFDGVLVKGLDRDSGEERAFRLDRIESLEPTPAEASA